MPSFEKTLLLAVGLALFIEGVVYALTAKQVPRFARVLADLDPQRIRSVGLILAVLGLAWMMVVRAFLFDVAGSP